MKKIFIILMLTLSFSAMALLGFGEDKKDTSKEKTAEECKIPAFAKAIGHEDKWLLHNGCPPREDTKKTEKNASK
ncbi:MAG: hypothetical protein PSN36_01065 [Gammaproteobacteria bacterium]|nr:hypothetical protein [Gammaproteobacteria bacterium]